MYKLEYEITRKLASNSVIHAYDLQRYQNGWMIVLEDFGGKSLGQILAQKKLNLVEFLNLRTIINDSLNKKINDLRMKFEMQISEIKQENILKETIH